MTTEFYTWRDVECALSKINAPPWLRASADAGSIRIECADGWYDRCKNILASELGSFDPGTSTVKLVSLPGAPRELPVEIIADGQVPPLKHVARPLWDSDRVPAQSSVIIPDRDVCAFYSYKGGVGRTTTVIAMLSEILRRNAPSRVLVIDADFEAPGLTWMLEPPTGAHFSYVDALAIVHDADDWENEALPLILSLIRESSVPLETAGGRCEFWFLPAIRFLDQLFQMPVRPEQLVRARNRAWIMGDLLFRVAAELRFDAVLVDMRTGVTEFSSPLLLDPRISKILVTSCNKQSVDGTVETLRRLRRAHPEVSAPEIVISFVTHDGGDVFRRVSEQLTDVFTEGHEDDVDVGEDLGIHRADFAQELLYFDSMDDFVLNRLPGTALSKKVAPDLIDRILHTPSNTNGVQEKVHGVSPRDVAKALEKLEFAEQNAEIGLLPLPALRKMLDVTAGRLPNSVVIGSKGAGKTFAWGQLVLSKTLSAFAQLIEREAGPVDANMFPLLAPSSMGPPLAEAVADLEKTSVPDGAARMSRFELRRLLEDPGHVTDSLDFWLRMIALRLGRADPAGSTVREKMKSVFADVPRVVLIVDGLEEAFQVAVGRGLSESQARLLRSLLQDFPNVLRETGIPNVGIIVFVRRDLAAAAISQNFGQFEALHRDTSLTWTPADALRLPLWILQKLGWPTETLDVARASYEELRRALVPFWGEKMGGKREAFTDEWVIATLSDFNLVLQPRDMIRLIRRATEASRTFPIPHRAIRNALPEVSHAKIDELAKEITALSPIFDRLRKETDPSKRVVPFSPEDVGLDSEEVAFLQQLGLLARSAEPDKLFMPEIIRHGLGFRLANRGRARVLALYREARQRRQS